VAVPLVILTVGVASAQESVPAAEFVQWDFEDGDIAKWQHKDNATLAVADEGGERGKVLELSTDYGEFGFAWTTHRPGPTMDFTDIAALEFMIRGDGSGCRVRATLGILRPGEGTLYYSATPDEVIVDFTGWRKCRMHLARIEPVADSDLFEDFARVGFVQFMVTALEAETSTLAFDDVRAVPAEGDELAALNQYRQTLSDLAGDMPKDGGNILPNAGFEVSVSGTQPLFWRANAWGTTSRPMYVTDGGHESKASVRITCDAKTDRGDYAFNAPVEPGPYLLSAWVRARTPDAENGNGPVVRLSFINEGGKGGLSKHYAADPRKTAWQHIEERIEVQPGMAVVQVHLFNYFARGTVQWDDVSLAWDVAEADRRENERAQNAADLATVGPMVVQAEVKLSELKTRLEAGGEPDAEAQMLLAMLEWALDDAGLAVEAELGTNALATTTSLLDYIARADEVLAQARAARVPTLDPEADANPYIAELNRTTGNFARDPIVYKKGEEGYAQIDNAWSFSSLGGQVAQMTWGLTDPRSKLHMDASLVKNLFATLQCVLQNHRDGDWNPGRQAIYGADPNIPRFTLGPTFDAYYQLTQACPWLILPAKNEEWLGELRTCVEHQYETYGLMNFTTGAYGSGNYPNQDVYYILLCELAHRTWGDSKWAEHRDLFVDFLEDTIFPMGGMIYHGTQNECYGYHQLNIAFTARYLEYTGSEQARRIIEKTVEFYPLMVEPSGRVEGYTDPSWKHSQPRVAPQGPEIVASITGDARNKRCANIGLARARPTQQLHNIFTAPWWREMPEEPLADNYIVFDENVQAPRARFGPFSFAANARDFGPGQIGKDTFIGCLYSPVGGAAEDESTLLIATSEFRLKPEGIHWRNARFVSGEEQFSHVMAPDFFSLAVKYRITAQSHGGKSATLPWEGTQQWFASPNRLVGLLHITALEDYPCAGIWGRLRLGQNLAIEQGEGDFYKYGPLLARIHDHNYATVGTQPSEVFYLDVPEKFKGTEIILRDADSATVEDPEQTTYPAGTDHWFLAEILPYTSELAEDVVAIDDGDLRGLSFREGNVTWYVVHNLGAKKRTWRGEAPDGAACSIYRGLDAGDGQALPVRRVREGVAIAPLQHVVIKVVAQ